MAEDIFKVIFELEAKGTGVLDEINKVKSKYQEVNTEIQRQQEEISKLIAKQAALQKGREAANSASAVAKYDEELKKVNKELEKRQLILTAVNKKEIELTQTSTKLAKNLDAAFKTTQINALNSEIAKMSKGFVNPINQADLLQRKLNALKDVRAAAKTAEDFDKLTKEIKETEKEFDKATGTISNGFGGAEKKALSLRAQLKILKAQLADTDDDAEFNRLSIAAGKLEDKLGDAAAASRIFASDSKFEVLGNAIGNVGQKLLALDFDGALQGSKLLVQASKQMTFKDALGGIKQLGQTLFNVGKALLTNPLFLIGAAVVLLISNFEKLKASGGAIGTVFKNIGKIIDGAIETFFALTDAIGATTHAMDKLNDKIIAGSKAVLEQQQKNADRAIKVAQAAERDTDKLEKQKAKNVIDNANVQLAAYKRIRAGHGELTEEQKKDELDLINARADAATDIIAIDEKANRERLKKAKEYADNRNKIFDDLDKRLREEQNKTLEFNNRVGNAEGIKQIKETFAIRKKIEDEQLTELRKNTLKELKTKADIEKAKQKLDAISAQVAINRENDKKEAILNIQKQLGDEAIAQRKSQDDLLLEKFASDTNGFVITEVEIAEKRLDIQKKFFADSIALAEKDIAARKALGFDVTAQEKALSQLRLQVQVEEAKATQDINNKKLNQELELLNQSEEHQKAALELRNARQSTILKSELEFEKARLTLLKNSGNELTDEYKKQQDKVAALSKEAHKQETLEYVAYTEIIVKAAIDATNKVLSAKIKEIDTQSNLQQRRVDEAKDIAKDGNAELLQLEQERLDDLTKQKEKFVRDQQALAAIELVANTAIAVSKAAAEGGAGAAFTIAAALIALVAGLASARSIASQAAFYDGGLYDGEGYTGDGNPREASTRVGKKPYTYHKEEFIFNHQTTRKNKDIFQDIHRGNIDLQEWKKKVAAYDHMNIRANYGAMPAIVNNTVEINELKQQMNELITVVRNQRSDISFDENGFNAYLKGVSKRHDFIKNNLAK